MNIKTQLQVRSNPNIYRYLREYSYWYKYLNRNGESIKELEREMKDRYKLRTEDKLESINNSISLIHSFLFVVFFIKIFHC